MACGSFCEVSALILTVLVAAEEGTGTGFVFNLLLAFYPAVFFKTDPAVECCSLMPAAAAGRPPLLHPV
jgi:hypothetical protein